MADNGSSFFNPSGLLTPEQTGSVQSRALMQMGAALMKASGPSPYKNTAFSGIGQGVEGLLGGIDSGTNEMLKQQLMRGQIGAQQLNLLNTAAQYQGMGIPVPPQLEQMLKMFGGGMPPGVGAGAPSVAPGAPPAPQSAPAMPPGPAAPPSMAPAPGAPQAAPGGPMAAPAAPAAPPAPAMNPATAAMIQKLPMQDRYTLLGGGPAADIVKATVSKNLETTPEQKNATASGFANPRALKAAEGMDTKEVEQESKLYGGLQAQGNTAAQMLDQLSEARSIVNDPKFYSGAGEGATLMYKKFLAAVAPGHENDAMPQEAFRKVMAGMLQQQINDSKAAGEEMGTNSARLFAPQIRIMEDAQQNPDSSIAANRYRTEVASRVANMNIKVADDAADWKASHNSRLGPDYEKHLRSFFRDNPIFTADELRDLRKVASAPASPDAAAAAPAAPLPVGYVHAGFQYKGGDPNAQTSWEKVQ